MPRQARAPLRPMNKLHLATHLLTAIFTATSAFAAAPRAIRFDKLVLTDQYFCDGISAGDINRDGRPDVVAGPYWYAGPEFKSRQAFYEPVPHPPEVSPTNSMFTFVWDFNGDGWNDILVLGRVMHHEAFWYENPGKKSASEQNGYWRKHFVCARVFGESPAFEDVDGDGRPEIVTHVDGRWGWFAPDPAQPEKPWQFHAVTEKGNFHHYYHGQGIGDINGDGQLDLVLNEGWWEQPPKSAAPGTLWTAHPFAAKLGEKGGAQILVYDVDGDGRNDLVSAIDAHRWGLSWFQQKRGENGAITFSEHRMMGDRSEEAKFGVAFSQPHALCAADLDGDGLLDVVTGKRRWAHGPKGDVEPMETPVNYAFLLRRDGKGGAAFTPQLIDDASGLGVQINAADLNGDRRPDVITSSKLGAFVFFTKHE